MSLNPITFEFHNEMLFAQAKGELLFEDIVNHYETLFTLQDFFVGMPAIYDFTHVTHITGNLSAFEQTARDMGNDNIISKPSYVAIVVPAKNKSMNDIFNAYSQMMDYTHMNVSIFHENERALEWLAQQGIHQ